MGSKKKKRKNTQKTKSKSTLSISMSTTILRTSYRSTCEPVLPVTTIRTSYSSRSSLPKVATCTSIEKVENEHYSKPITVAKTVRTSRLVTDTEVKDVIIGNSLVTAEVRTSKVVPVSEVTTTYLNGKEVVSVKSGEIKSANLDEDVRKSNVSRKSMKSNKSLELEQDMNTSLDMSAQDNEETEKETEKEETPVEEETIVQTLEIPTRLRVSSRTELASTYIPSNVTYVSRPIVTYERPCVTRRVIPACETRVIRTSYTGCNRVY